jgi:hypothetical protein
LKANYLYTAVLLTAVYFILFAHFLDLGIYLPKKGIRDEILDGLTAVVTGGARGIGHATAERLLHRGVSVSI